MALARALVNDPKALLLDEPLSALDAELRRQMQLELKRIQRDIGITFVFVTHDQEEALTMSDRIAVMRNGHLEQLGTPEEIYDEPQSAFVARFIGSANLMPVTVERTGGGRATVVLPGGRRAEAPTGGRDFARGRRGAAHGAPGAAPRRPRRARARPRRPARHLHRSRVPGAAAALRAVRCGRAASSSHSSRRTSRGWASRPAPRSG